MDDNNFQNGKIYRLTCDDPNLIYYGSTIMSLEKRLKHHKSASNRSVSRQMRDFGGLKIELLEQYPCNSKKELLDKEQYYIQNNQCINQRRALLTKEQRLQQKRAYYERNTEKFKEYREANKEKSKEYMRAYYQSKKLLNST